jgi:hypothetical protein
MKTRPLFVLALAVCTLSSPALAQFDDSFVFDDSMFDDSSLFDTNDSAPGHFRFRLSHQSVAHINRHTRSIPGGGSDTRSRGLENNRSALNTRYQNPFRDGWLLQASAQLRAYLRSDYEHNNPTREDWEWRLNELFVQRSGEHNSLTFGRQTIVWGETIGNSVLDVINTTEYRDLTIIDIEDARLNQWLAVWDHFSDNGTWSSFINLYPEFDPLPVDNSPLFPGSPLRLPHYHRDKALFELGTRWSRSFTGSDIAIMAARLYENDLRFTPPNDGSNRAIAHINDYSLLGFSANRAIDRLLLTLDVSFSQGVLADTLENATPALSKGDLLGISAGFEYGISATRQISVGMRFEKLQNVELKHSEQLNDLRQETRGDLLIRYSHSIMNEEVLLSATFQGQLDGEAGLLNLAADYRINDDWELRSQLIMTRADSASALYFLDQDVRLGLTLSYSF